MKQTFTAKGRQRVCSMPTLWGKEWGAVKQLIQVMSGIDEKLGLIALSLQDNVTLQREQIDVLKTTLR